MVPVIEINFLGRTFVLLDIVRVLDLLATNVVRSDEVNLGTLMTKRLISRTNLEKLLDKV